MELSSTTTQESPTGSLNTLLNSEFRFKPESTLKSYLIQKAKIASNDCLTLANVRFSRCFSEIKSRLIFLLQILILLREIIRDGRLYDASNPSIIMCDKDLETALNMKALHVTQIR